MNTRIALLTVGLLTAAGLLTPAPVFLAPAASGFDISRTRTEAGIVTSASGALTIQLRFAAELINGIPDLTDDVEVGWQQVGGIDPEPFRVLIPAGCFVNRRTRGFVVEDFSRCGVQMSVDSGARGVIPVSIVDFEARVVRRDDGTYRFDINAVMGNTPDDTAPAFLGILGGAAVEIAIGSAMSMSPPLRIDTVSGVDPEPF